MIKRAVRDCADCELLVLGKCIFGPKKVPAGKVITPQDTVARELSFVRKGAIALTVVNAEGDHTHVAVRGPRSMVGLEALRGLSSPAEVAAVTDVELCVASMQKVGEWVGPMSGARRMFELSLDEMLEQRRDVDFRSGSAATRVARFLLLCSKHLSRGPGAPFSKGRAASVLGLRPETLSRVLKRLAQKGLIENGSSVRILDLARLGALATSE